VNQAAEMATANLRAATGEAITMVHQATATIIVAIEAANKALVETTQNLITEIVGEEKGELFDLGSLKKRWKAAG